MCPLGASSPEISILRLLGASHCFATQEQLEKMMINTSMLTKDLGTILVGNQAVKEGIINEVGGIDEAMKKLHSMIAEYKGEEMD